MGAWIKDETHLERRKFIDYIYGLIRYEVSKGQDNDRRLEVLSKIHYDLLYVENLEHAEGWQKKLKGKGELDLALDKLQHLTKQLEETKSNLILLNSINDKMTKKDIMDLIEKVKKEVS